MDKVIKISVCNRKTNVKYKNQECAWSYLKERNRCPIRTSETVTEYQKASKAQRDALKDQGGFVGGWLKDGRRLVQNVLTRSVGMLDADNVPADVDFPALAKDVLSGIEYFLYSTHSHTPESPRFRLVILFEREVTPDEYPALMRMVARQIGMDYFDDSTYQANRMMYWASCPANGEFVFEENEGEALRPETYLGMYEDWRDVSQWPTSSRQSEAIQKSAVNQQDPLSKSGLVGVFNRAFFPIQTVLETFLSKEYEPAGVTGRYTYTEAEGVAGLVVYDDKFVYSFHATDPACEQLCNAFDIVRIHLFKDKDEKASYAAMCEFAQRQPAVRELIQREREEQASFDFKQPDESWMDKLVYMPRSKLLENSVWNLMLILTHDPDFANIAYNEMASRIEVTGAVPWDRPESNPFWREADTAQMKAVIDMRYLPFSTRNHDVCFTKMADDRRFHPVRDYLNALPAWDGVERVPTLLTRCLGADDSEYVRTVTRKFFAAAVARIYQPGIKFDSVLVLDGIQGIGKSSIFKALVGDAYYSESLSLTDMEDKTGAEKLQGFWIVEIGELAGMKKADIEKVKSFLATSDDKYRPSYGKTVESHPRQCAIIATVNGERGYLRDITGNRRFWIVKCRQEDKTRRWDISPEERDQLWAEAKHYYEQGEKLYLEDEILEASEEVQRESMEVDERLGLVEEYLDMLLPENWDKMDIYERRNYISERNSPIAPVGTVHRDAVTNAEIWCECFGKNISELKPSDCYAIAALMTQIDGWERSKTVRKIPIYGRQRLYQCEKNRFK